MKMIINKWIKGTVCQQFDSKTGKFIGQNFIPDQYAIAQYTDEYGILFSKDSVNSFDLENAVTNMVQPSQAYPDGDES